MATQAEYTALANDLVVYARQLIAENIPTWEQSFIPMEKLPTFAGAVSKHCIDFIDKYRAQQEQTS